MFLCRRSSPSSFFRPLTLAKPFKSPPFFPETPSALLPLQPVPAVGRVLPEGGEGEGGQGRLQIHEGHGRHLLQVRTNKYILRRFPRIGTLQIRGARESWLGSTGVGPQSGQNFVKIFFYSSTVCSKRAETTKISRIIDSTNYWRPSTNQVIAMQFAFFL